MSSELDAVVARLRAQRTDDADVEVKTSAKKLSGDVWDSVSAFANTAGGTIVLGLSEADNFSPTREFDVETIRDQFIEGMGDGGLHGAKLGNPPQYGIRRDTVDGKPVLVITIGPNAPGQRPCYVLSKSLNNGSYKRVDDKDIRLSAAEIFEMQHELVPSDADKNVVEEADLSDLDHDAISDLIEQRKGARVLQGTSTLQERLVRLNITNKKGQVRLAGLLAMGTYPQQFYPRLFVDVTVHPGNEKSLPGSGTRFLERIECVGKLSDVVSDAVQAVIKNLRTYSVVDGVGRKEVPEIPVVVLREAIANAVLHREYSPMFLGQPVAVDVFADRIEITNPGGLWGGLTLESIGDGTSRCRNTALLALMQHASISGSGSFTVEGQGSGVRLMFSEMEAHALKKPEYSVTADQVKVTLARHGAEIPEHRAWVADLAGREFDSYEDTALLLARQAGLVTVDQLRVTLRIDSEEARAILRRLKTEGLLFGSDAVGYTIAEGAPLPSDEDAKILQGLAGKGEQSIHEIAEWSGLTLGTARVRLRGLVESGWVRATAPPQSKKRKYVLSSNS